MFDIFHPLNTSSWGGTDSQMPPMVLIILCRKDVLFLAQKKKRGRPSKMTVEVVTKLEEAFAKGLSDREACLYAGISHETFYNYCEKHYDFRDRKELLKNTPILNAKMNVAEGIERGDKELSKWYLERKCKDEFSVKQDIGLNGKVVVPLFVGEDEFDCDE